MQLELVGIYRYLDSIKLQQGEHTVCGHRHFIFGLSDCSS